MGIREAWNEILKKNRSLYIYGAGHVGKQIISLITADGGWKKIKGVVVSDYTDNPKFLNNIPVILPSDIQNKDSLILISVGDRYQETVKKNLENRGFKNYIIAYPYSVLAVTDDLNIHVYSIADILDKQIINGIPNRIDLIVRLDAIRRYYAQDKDAFAEYKKMMELRNHMKDGNESVIRFKHLIDSFEKDGYNPDSEIWVNTEGLLLDGLHRLSLAIYHDLMFIKVRIIRMEPHSNYFDYSKEGMSVCLSSVRCDELELQYWDEFNKARKKIYTEERLKEKLIVLRGNDLEFSKSPFSGEALFYQDFPRLHIAGRRSTDLRIDTYGLKDLVAGKDVLDIGCNCGFLDSTIAQYAKKVKGIDCNHALITIASETQKYIHADNLCFQQADFNTYTDERRYDVIFSFAVHFWIKMNCMDYIKKLKNLLCERGSVVFESQDMTKDATEKKRYDRYLQCFIQCGFTMIRNGMISDEKNTERAFAVFQLSGK